MNTSCWISRLLFFAVTNTPIPSSTSSFCFCNKCFPNLVMRSNSSPSRLRAEIVTSLIYGRKYYLVSFMGGNSIQYHLWPETVFCPILSRSSLLFFWRARSEGFLMRAQRAKGFAHVVYFLAIFSVCAKTSIEAVTFVNANIFPPHL